MPRGDRSGPSGEGPKTGKGMGYCTENEHPGYMNTFSNRGRGFGRGFQGGQGYGRGAGFGFRHGYGNSYQGGVPDVSEKTLIENEIRILKDQMSALEERLSKTEKE
ncbi:MAG: DUF5320 domain-containing protein [Bacteroidales bacterium]|nr:DUF5320 domain-containing protein [Bacteroidales bacterium]